MYRADDKKSIWTFKTVHVQPLYVQKVLIYNLRQGKKWPANLSLPEK